MWTFVPALGRTCELLCIATKYLLEDAETRQGTHR
jgi:hypothetical protein